MNARSWNQATRHARQLAEPGGQRVGVLLVAQLDGDLAQRLVARDRDRLDVADQPAVLGDPASPTFASWPARCGIRRR